MHRLVLAEFRPFSKHYPGPFKFKSQIPRSFIPQISISRPLLSYQPITSTAVMSTMKALVMQGGTDAKVVERSLPKPRSKFVGVKVNAVALNPTDWKHIKGLNQEGLLVGCDFAGTVEKTGEGYNTKWSVGDRICGFVHGWSGPGLSNPQPLDRRASLYLPTGSSDLWPRAVPRIEAGYPGQTSQLWRAHPHLRRINCDWRSRYSATQAVRLQSHYDMLSQKLRIRQVSRCRCCIRLQLSGLC
jgi:hypothetical protein